MPSDEKVPVTTLPKIRKKLTEHEHPEWIVETEYLADIFKDMQGIVGVNGSIFQPGCGCGYVLDALWEVGYRNLTGLDRNYINTDGSDWNYWNPKIKFIHAELEDAIDGVKQYDVVLGHRFFQVLPEGYDWLFGKLASRARKFIVTLEGEDEDKTSFWHHHKRNYKEVFEKYGFLQVFEETNVFPLQNFGIKTMILRVFKRK